MLLCVFCLAPSMVGAAQGERVALLIGNATYSSGPLRNPPADVLAMEAALRAVGFKVETVLNANQNQMKRAVRDFGEHAQGVDIAFLYYSGHGTQANGENYLIPIHADIKKESDYEVEAVSANALMRQIAGARPRAAIVVLDACRDNPYASFTRGGPKGLGRMDAPTGTMIAFATAPNATASDEGFYARVLAVQIKTPGVELLDVFRNTTAEVRRLSGNKQEPRVSEVSITDRIYLAGSADTRPSVQVASIKPEPQFHATNASVADSDVVALDSPGAAFRDCPNCPEMVWIPPGNFMMGNNEGNDIQKPMHAVQIRYRLAVGKYPVTRGQFAQFVRETGYAGNSTWRNVGFTQDDKHPVVNVNRDDAQSYIKWLVTKTGNAYRLLSESEYEYAARAGTTTNYYWGDAASHEYANYGADISACCRGAVAGRDQWFNTSPVGSFKANQFGLYDMLGNVLEWTEGCWTGDYSNAPSDGSPEKKGDCTQSALRGASWYGTAQRLRADYRIHSFSAERSNSVGFRISRSMP